MNAENKNAGPATDLRLAPGNSNNTTQGRSTGAGANAASNIDITFAATDPLSELVWSPQRGLSLKCTEQSVLDKKTSHLSGAGPSNAVFPARIVSNDKHIDEDYFDESMLRINTEVSNIEAFRSLLCCVKNGYAGSSGGEEQKGYDGFMKERHKSFKESFHNLNGKGNPLDCSTVNICDTSDPCIAKGDKTKENISPLFPEEQKVEAQTESLSKNSVVETRDIDAQKRMSKSEIFFPPKVYGENQSGAGELQVLREKSSLFREEESEKAMKKGHFPGHCLLEKLEKTAENDFPSLVNEKVHVATNKITTCEFADEARRNSQQDEVEFQQKTVSSEGCVINSRIKPQRKRKEKKALSDGDVEGRMSKDGDDSHESVESCNSAGMFHMGKRRWSFEQQLNVGSKRVKKQIQETPGCSSSIKQDSSFMNWISNMMKGFPKVKHEVPSLALTLSDSNAHQDLVPCNENKHPGIRNSGFGSIFHSIYCPKLKVQAPRAPNENDLLDADIACNICDTDATPIACSGENVQLAELFPLPRESEAGLENQMEIPPRGGIKTNSESYPEGNKNSCSSAQKDRTSSSSSMGKDIVTAAVHIDSDTPSEGKARYDVIYRSDPLGSLWITRFASKVSGLLSNQDTVRQSTSRTIEFPDDLKVSRQQSEENPLTGLSEELNGFTKNIGASAGFSKIKNKLNTITTSPRLKNSEAMASLFARRLDALKQIVSFGVPEDAAHITATCFFCGKKGHHLRDCSEITETDLKYLVHNMKPYNGVDELPSICIRCFQLNHWAVSCPNVPSRVELQSDPCASFLSRGKKKCDDEDLRSHTNQAEVGAHTACSTLGVKACDKLNHLITADKIRSATDLQETFKASSSRIVEAKEGSISPLHGFTRQQLSDIPKGIFDAIKMLRLSRTDILRCMKSQMTLSSLDGFFVRLRLGKWQEGLCGTGYYVASINEVDEEIPDSSSKSCIHVNVGRVKCLVESQYISNHDFLEDELKAWWSTIKRSGCHIPSEEDLRNKVKEKRALPF